MGAPLLAFHITDRCQLNCQHCLRDPGARPKDLDVDVIARVLDEGRRVFGATRMSVTGGEPTLHPRFLDIVDAAVDRGFQWQMVSNGRSFPRLLGDLEARPARLAGIRSIFFSLDGADQETHDHIRGEGSFHEVMDAVAVCVARDVPFVLQFVVHALNAHQLEQVGLLAAQLGAERLSVAQLQPTGTFLDASMALTAAQWQDLQVRVDALGEVLRMPVTRPEGWSHHATPFHQCTPWKSETLHVDLDGRLNLCCQLAGIPDDGRARDVGADLRTTSLAQAQAAMLPVIAEVQQARLQEIEGGADGWKAFSCNSCLKHFGKPWWVDDAAQPVAGPAAARPRWKGAWSADEVKARVEKSRPRALPVLR
jgi:MoaA/NifB/PqqE/SkfB family radical SAM enzyme